MMLKNQIIFLPSPVRVKVLEVELQRVLNFTTSARSRRNTKITVVGLNGSAVSVNNRRNRVVRRAARSVSASHESAIELTCQSAGIATELRRVERIEHFKSYLNARRFAQETVLQPRRRKVLVD